MPQAQMSDTLFDAIVEYRTKRLRRSSGKNAPKSKAIDAARDYFLGNAPNIRAAAARHCLSASMVSKMILSLNSAYEDMKADEGLIEVKLVVPQAQGEEVCAYGDRVLQAVRNGVDTPRLMGELEIMKCQLRASSRVSPELACRLKETIVQCHQAHCHDAKVQRSLDDVLDELLVAIQRGEERFARG